MKKILKICLAAFLLVSLCACGSKSSAQQADISPSEAVENGDAINITEKMYVTYVNEIYTNRNDYIGKAIKIEGMYKATEFSNGNTYYYVYRLGPGCCGTDGNMCGFEFIFDGDMPEDNDWIEVVGTLISYEEDGKDYLTIDAESVTVKKTRGAETVSQ